MIVQALHNAGGAQYLTEQAHANPTAFMSLIGRVLPMQLEGAGGGALVVDFRWADAPPVIEAAPVVDAVSHETNDAPEITFQIDETP